MEKEKLLNLLKKLEGVYKITIDKEQKERVAKEIKELKEKITKIEEEEQTALPISENKNSVEIQPENISEENETDETFEILDKIKVTQIHPECTDYEINAAATYINYFENELWSVLSDFHLKLDYFYSKEREKLYNGIENSLRILKEYKDVLEEIRKAVNTEYKEKMLLMKNKLGRAFLIESSSFMKKINDFLSKILNDYQKGGNIILDPAYNIKFSHIEGKKLLNGWNIIDAIEYICKFSDEFLRKINIPENILKM